MILNICMKHKDSSQRSDEELVLEYLASNPVPTYDEHHVYDENGNVRPEIKNRREYKGLIEALRGREPFSASSLFMGTDTERFRYAKEYSSGQEFLNQKQAS